ncbi:stress response protein SCP2 [Streptacidiphilus sp. MAP12-20]|uniref:TerD family protein n=1 Tax=Streptacidiphilus sp. MAP12-20 TaxID=3156299 RepID=UPI0035182129
MTEVLSSGGNVPLGALRVTVEVAAPRALDVSALLLAASGKVRSDADLVFFNAPEGPGVRWTPGGGITVDMSAVPADVDKVVVTASLDDAAATFAGTEPTATVRDATSGEALATFTPARLGVETALVVVELYRRGGAWKLRAVGQGYANGLAGIATDFGVVVDDPGPAAAPTVAAAAPAPISPPVAPVWEPVPAPIAPPAAPAPTPPAPAPATTRVTLDKGRVSLTKGSSVSLIKDGKPFLASVRMGLGWEPARHARSIDLDASVVAYDNQRGELEKVWFSHLSGFNGAIQHAGDSLTGEGSGDDETITVHLQGLPPQVTGLVFTVNSYSGQKFTEVRNAYCRLVDATTNTELVRFDLTNAEPRTGVLMCKLVRMLTGEWVMTALGVYADGKTVKEMVRIGAASL